MFPCHVPLRVADSVGPPPLTGHVRRAGAGRPADAASICLENTMPRVLLADNDFPDLGIERELFGNASVDLATAQCKTEDDVIGAARDCAGILLQYAPITERVVAALPNVGIVSRIGAGFDTVDTEACARHGVWVANSPDYGVGEVATHALALIARDRAQHPRLSPRHPCRTMALPVVGSSCAARAT